MSTKNLARTVIEGGRAYYNCWERRYSHAAARAAERERVHDVRTSDADALVWPEAKHVRRSFHDKLSAVERWLRSQIGRPWDRVRGEIFARFDTRTLAGQHIVFDHLLPGPRDRDGCWRVSRDVHFFVDDHAILRAHAPPRIRRPWHPTQPSSDDIRAIAAFAQGRKIVARGTHVYWLVRAPAHEPGALPRFRQDRALDARERATLAGLSAVARAQIEVRLP